MSTSTSSIAAFCAVLVLASGCSGLYHKPHRLNQSAVENRDEYLLRYIEADDEGWFWDRHQAEDTMRDIEKSAEEMDTFVVVFVHGWHHSAECCDTNVEGFKETLLRLNKELSKPAYQGAREAISGKADAAGKMRLIGVYIGWRGASLPGWLDYLTFWGRKSAAERVGRTDLREFLARLNHSYRQHNELERSKRGDEKGTDNFLGLVTIGHSFGGDVVLRSVVATLEDELEQHNPTVGYLRNSEAATPPAAKEQSLHGYGDLVVLLNPAVEASAYQRLHVLAQGLSYRDGQDPLMLTISADNDYPRGRFFRWGRIVGEWFGRKPHKDTKQERDLERTALGVYGPKGVQITHRLEPTDLDLRLRASRIPHQADKNCKQADCLCEWYDWNGVPKITKPDSLPQITSSNSAAELLQTIPELTKYDFSKDMTFDNVTLTPKDGAIPYQPFIVASAHEAIINGHNGIFSTPLIHFLVRYVALIEAKEYVLTLDRKRGRVQ